MTNKINAFDLLDREEVWTWGDRYWSFEENVLWYLKAITELGRPLARQHKDGKWSRAYNFLREYTKYRTYHALSVEKQNQLRSLPHFFRPQIEERVNRDLTALLAFKTEWGRVPRQQCRAEAKFYHIYRRLLFLKRNGKLPGEALNVMNMHGLIPMTRESRKPRLLEALKLFLHEHNRRPSQRALDAKERKLYYNVKSHLLPNTYGTTDAEFREAVDDIYRTLTITDPKKGPK